MKFLTESFTNSTSVMIFLKFTQTQNPFFSLYFLHQTSKLKLMLSTKTGEKLLEVYIKLTTIVVRLSAGFQRSPGLNQAPWVR